MFELELVSFPNLGLQLCRLRFLGIQSLSNDLVQKVVSEDFHDRSIQRRPLQREHLLEPMIRKSNSHIAVRDQNAFDQARQDGAQAKVLVGNFLSDLSLSLCHLFQVLVNLPEDSRTLNFIGKRSVGHQVTDFATQNKQPAPEQDRRQGKGAQQNEP